MASADFARAAGSLRADETIHVAGVRTQTGSVGVTLRRFSPWSDDARVVVHGAAGESVITPPGHLYFKGGFDGEPDSRVVVSVRASGAVEGLALRAGGVFAVGDAGAAGSGLSLRPIDMAGTPPRTFRCDEDRLPAIPGQALESDSGPLDLGAALASGSLGSLLPDAPQTVGFTARIAIETDGEFYQVFNDVDKATTYVGDLIAYASGFLYEPEVSTSMTLVYLNLWTGGPGSDPWNQTSAFCQFMQLGKYWNDNNGSIARTTVHMMSGKSFNSGIAWVGVLCSGAFNVDITGAGCSGLANNSNYGGGYGFTSSIAGSFHYDNPAIVWDLVAVSHEIGHNFNSPHTHCYAGIGGNSSQVDRCFVNESDPGGDTCNATTHNWNVSGCACDPGGDPATLPGSGSTHGGTTSEHPGTIMSYCHLLSGGFSNLTYTFGQGFAFGVAADRVPTQMHSHVVAQDSSHHSCLDFLRGTSVIFRDGFETQNTSRWSFVQN